MRLTVGTNVLVVWMAIEAQGAGEEAQGAGFEEAQRVARQAHEARQAPGAHRGGADAHPARRTGGRGGYAPHRNIPCDVTLTRAFSWTHVRRFPAGLAGAYSAR